MNIVATRYAAALLNVAKEIDKVIKFKKQLKSVEKIFNKNEKLKVLLTHPKLSLKEKKDIVWNIFNKKVSMEILNFLFVLIDKKRLVHLNEIVKEYERFANNEMNILPVKVITAIELTEPQKQKLMAKLKKKFNKEIEIKNEVDKKILGGIIIKARDKIIDASFNTNLDKARKSIYRMLGV